jgi:hypothetical protein
VVNFLDATVSCTPYGVENLMFSIQPTSPSTIHIGNTFGQVWLVGDVVGLRYRLFERYLRFQRGRGSRSCGTRQWNRDRRLRQKGVRSSCECVPGSRLGEWRNRAAPGFFSAVSGAYAHEIGHNLGM